MDKKNKDLEKEERDKRLVMWTGVSFFMFLIVFLWFLNTKTVFFNISNTPKQSQFNIDQVSKEFDNIFKEAEEQMKELELSIELEEEDSLGKQEKNEEEAINKIEILKNKLESEK